VNRRLSEGDWLQAISHRHRIEILRRLLTDGTATPADLARDLQLPLGVVSYHVKALAKTGVIRLAGRTQRRGAIVHHYQLTDRERAASIVWGMRATLLVSDFERENSRGDATVRLDAQALVEMRSLTADFLARMGELGLQTRERRNTDAAGDDGGLMQIAVLLATDRDDDDALG
jgi:predicted ArsR family transcriptional regulator